MDKQELVNILKNMSKQHNGIVPENVLDQMETLIKKYLQIHPKDTDIWLRLIQLEFNAPREDPYLISNYVNHIFSYDPNNIQALLILAYTQCILIEGIEEQTFLKLQKIKSDNSTYNAMIELAKAWYYEQHKNWNLYEKTLIKSIEFNNTFVQNYNELGRFYIHNGQKEKGQLCIKKALSNVTEVYGKNFDNDDNTDINEFFNIFFKGIHTTSDNVESLKNLLI